MFDSVSQKIVYTITKRRRFFGIEIWAWIFLITNGIYFNVFKLGLLLKLIPKSWLTVLHSLLLIIESISNAWIIIFVGLLIIWAAYWRFEKSTTMLDYLGVNQHALHNGIKYTDGTEEHFNSFLVAQRALNFITYDYMRLFIMLFFLHVSVNDSQHFFIVPGSGISLYSFNVALHGFFYLITWIYTGWQILKVLISIRYETTINVLNQTQYWEYTQLAQKNTEDGNSCITLAKDNYSTGSYKYIITRVEKRIYPEQMNRDQFTHPQYEKHILYHIVDHYDNLTDAKAAYELLANSD
ncbi:hypothetical protein HAU32_07975 [Weissella confusa]|uniref:ABC transporter permease n=1 Tax=Weissella fermenti TaxID=2987699 RepID=A0ABT6D1C5_9LACO|nr:MULTISPECIES: hypothetical protein [Weissella]MBJ7688909.1 hypothetical protein [Weissella confusa]MCW0926306.1 hypothetical protein [Weissella sp. LMG 11983]MDF9298729.1 hypothetical protein [Weissella sp. BK2]